MLKRLQCWSVVWMTTLALTGVSWSSYGQISNKEAAKAAKVTPDLLAVQQNGLPSNAAPAAGLQKLNLFQTSGDRIAIEAVAQEGQSGDDLLRELQTLGLTKGIAYQRLVFGYIPVAKLGDLKTIKSLRLARPSYRPQHNAGAVTSQGDKAMRSDIARQTYGVSGTGVKIGVISDSYNGLGGAAAGVASGDLPANVQVIDDYLEPDATDEGRAMVEIVHDVAPGAAVAFNTAYYGQAGFAKGIRDLAAAGCKIITDDVGYFNEPFFQDGIISQAIKDVVTNQKVTYFTSAGNSERSSYESPFVKGGSLSDPFLGPLGQAHDFGGGDYYQKITIPAYGRALLVFQWDDRFYSVNGGTGAQTDMDLLIYYNGVLRPDLSSYNPNIGDDPWEFTGINNNSNAPVSVEIVLTKYAGPDPTRVKWINDNSSSLVIEHDTKSSSIFGHSNESTAVSVGAARYDQTPTFNSALKTARIEYFSTAGGTPILFDEAGNRIAPVVRNKPEIVAADGGNTTFFGFPYENDPYPNFFGTSASAPHAAGVAALMQEKAGYALMPSSVLSIMEQTALDMDDPLTPAFDTGFDFLTGYGFIQADKALQAITSVTPTSFAIANVSTVSCETVTAGLRKVTFQPQYSGENGQPVTFWVQNETVPTTNPGPYTVSLYTDNPVVTLKAIQSGTAGEATFAYNWLAACTNTTPLPPIPGTLAITGVEGVSCSAISANKWSLTFSPTYSGLNGQAITFSVVNETLPTTAPGPYTVSLYTDNPVIKLKAVQAGTPNEATYAYNWVQGCGIAGARLAAAEGTGLQVRVLGNPIVKESAEIEISGVVGQSVTIDLIDTQGRTLQRRTIDRSGSVERIDLPVSEQKGILLLNVGSRNERKTVKLIR